MKPLIRPWALGIVTVTDALFQRYLRQRVCNSGHACSLLDRQQAVIVRRCKRGPPVNPGHVFLFGHSNLHDRASLCRFSKFDLVR